jgi:integrase
MNRIQKKLGIKQAKRSFGALRHTFRTVADETRDLPAILRVMGHADHTISDHYRERIADDRIEGVVNHVHQWLFKMPTKPTAKKKKRTGKGKLT